MECTKVNCPMQAGTPTDNCGENCPWRTTAKAGDLISRAAAIEAIVSVTAFPDAEYIKNLCQNPANSEDWLGGVYDAINAVEDVNAVNAALVVRCRDCKYAHMTYDGEVKYCDKISMPDDEGDYGYALYLPGDWFCADGERRDEDAAD